MRFAFRVFYDGREFHGSQRQPDVRTVEGELIKAFERSGLEYRGLMLGSRTDRGVSALGNVLAVTLKEGEVELGRINAFLPEDIVLWAVANVKASFNPRKARYRHYCYIVPEKLDITAVREVARKIEGVHDFRLFTPEKEGYVRKIDRIIVKEGPAWTEIHFYARAFLRQQVRRLTTVLWKVGNGEKVEIEKLLRGEGRPIPPAPPEFLFLVKIAYRGIEFTPDIYWTKRLAEKLEKMKSELIGTGAVFGKMREFVDRLT